MDQELAHFFVLENALADCEHLLLHFRGPVCDLSVWPVTAVTGRLRDLLADQGVPLPQAVRAASDPYALLRFTLAACPRLAARAEAEICQQEVLAAVAARPSPGIRTLLDGPAVLPGRKEAAVTFTVDIHHHMLPDFFWRATNEGDHPVGGIAQPPWSRRARCRSSTTPASTSPSPRSAPRACTPGTPPPRASWHDGATNWPPS